MAATTDQSLSSRLHSTNVDTQPRANLLPRLSVMISRNIIWLGADWSTEPKRVFEDITW